MCGLPAHRLEHYTNRMRRNHDVLVSSCPQATERRETVMERFSGPAGIRFPWAVQSTSAQNPMRCSPLEKPPSRFTTRNFRCSPRSSPVQTLIGSWRKIRSTSNISSLICPRNRRSRLIHGITAATIACLTDCAATVSIFWERASETRNTCGQGMYPHRSTKCGSCTMLCPKTRLAHQGADRGLRRPHGCPLSGGRLPPL